MPAVRPVNTPDVALIVPTDAVLLLQVPPVTVLDKDKVLPAQAEVPPEIGEVMFTVTTAVDLQPDDAMVYVIIEVPMLMPVAIPLDDPIDDTSTLELLHVPPAGADVSVVVPGMHILSEPETGEIGFTETKTVRLHPVGSV